MHTAAVKKYAEKPEKCAELLRLALAHMSRQEAGVHPISYAVWYEYVGGFSAGLRDEIDALTRNGGKLDEATTRRLYNKYIADLEPAVVKLDRALITEITSDRVFRLVRANVRMCHDLDARVVAEGIERPEELAGVQAAGVDLVQGYLVARPAAKPPRPEGWSHLFPRRAPLARGRSETGSMSPLPPVPLARAGSGPSAGSGTSGAGASRSPYESGSNPSAGSGATAGGSGSSTPGSGSG